MHLNKVFVRVKSCVMSTTAVAAGYGLAFLGALALAMSLSAPAQQVPQPPAAAPQQNQPAAAEPTPAPNAAAPAPEPAGGITEEQLRQMLVGKPLYLRGGYLGDNLRFAEDGQPVDNAPRGSYTLCAVQIDRVRLSKHKVVLEGARYGLHFLGALPYEDSTKAVDRVRITPKTKILKITIDRELVVTPKSNKFGWLKLGMGKPAAAAPTNTAAPAAPPSEASETDAAVTEARAEMAKAPEAERPADPRSVTTTLSAAHANQMLNGALDRIFAPGLDDRLIAAMPDFWKLYYQAAEAKTDYRPKDPAVLRQNAVDRKARLLTNFVPESNEYAQANAVAGMALYHTVIGADGKPGEVAVGRPIGFGLDENAVAAIRKASFEPAVKDGKPVPVMLDLVVQFRIYSTRTSAKDKPSPAAAPEPVQPAAPSLPGPYSVHHP
ncbi:MAG: energy transducer TonB [Terracidiphilus sp.]|nr:energy transducer TonB [Terracidiphilus sp.]